MICRVTRHLVRDKLTPATMKLACAASTGSLSWLRLKGGTDASALMRRLFRDSSGQDLAEYGIALAVVGLGVTTAAAAIAGNVEVLWENASSVIATAITKGKDTCCD